MSSHGRRNSKQKGPGGTPGRESRIHRASLLSGQAAGLFEHFALSLLLFILPEILFSGSIHKMRMNVLNISFINMQCEFFPVEEKLK